VRKCHLIEAHTYAGEDAEDEDDEEVKGEGERDEEC
jgi:hypothetical protein